MPMMFKPSKKLSPKAKGLLMAGGFWLFIFVLLVVSLLAVSRENKALKDNVQNLKTEVGELKSSLQDAGERLAFGDGPEAAEKEEVKPVNRIGLVATPGETRLTVSTPDGWALSGENKLKSGELVVLVQSEEIDLLTLDNYKVTRVVDSFTLSGGQTAFVTFIRTSSGNQGYLGLSFCNPDVGAACSYKGIDGKFVFVLAHSFKEGDQFLRDVDFDSEEGVRLLESFKIMMRSLEIS